MRALLFLRLAPAALLLAGCSLSSPSATAPTPHASVSAGAGVIPLATPTPGSSGTTTTFDAVHVYSVLAPAVGLIIVNTRSGVAEGSGFVVSHEGGSSFMLTNNHVVAGATTAEVLLPDGRHYTAQVQGTDSLEDLAVLKLPDAGLPLAEFGDSTKVKPGQPVAAIGSPEGSQGFGSITVGVISAAHRTLTGVGSGRGTAGENLPDVIQTDAPINPGNSGGPLADADGRVIGINTAGDTSANSIGFAIPSLVAKRIGEDLIAGRKPGHPYVGVSYQDLASYLAGHSSSSVHGFGIVVSCVVSGSPAERAGLKANDVVEKIDGTDLNNGETLGGVLQLHKPGDVVPFGVVRGSDQTTLQVTLGDRPASPGSC
ncbi:MAG TPA: trypsin-like peptidase domain-containing protein [Candidatus Dormibacteraeota bacterium]